MFKRKTQGKFFFLIQKNKKIKNCRAFYKITEKNTI